MLERAVSITQRRRSRAGPSTTLNLGLDLRITQEYIRRKISARTYKRVSSIRSEDEAQRCCPGIGRSLRQIARISGKPFGYAVLKSICERLRISAVERQGSRLAISLSSGNANRSRCVGQRSFRSREESNSIPAAFSDENDAGEVVPVALRNVLLALEARG